MRRLNLDRVEDRFPTIYITLISVLLAIGLEDTVSQVRAVESSELFNWLIAVYVGGTTLAAWTGFSFIAITQVRRPRLLDSVNVFGLAVGVFMLNSTIGQPHHWFFFAFALYMFLAAYPVTYNMPMLGEALPYEYRFRDWHWTLWALLIYMPPYLVIGWFSYQGTLSEDMELFFLCLALTQPISWATLFYSHWKKSMDLAAQVLANTEA